VRNLRTDVSLLLSQGHIHAQRYPIATVWVEAEIVRSRINHGAASESLLMYQMLGAVLNGKAGAKEYRKSIKALTDDN
jgi:hypothetical protein